MNPYAQHYIPGHNYPLPSYNEIQGQNAHMNSFFPQVPSRPPYHPSGPPAQSPVRSHINNQSTQGQGRQ